MTNLCKTALAFMAFLIASASLALGQGTYVQIDDPDGVNGTYVQGIDNAGDIVGFYTDATITTHGFLLSGGVYTTIDYPGSQNTELYGVNAVGQIVGFSTYPSPVVGFLYDVATQTFTTISYPGATITYPYAINDAGTIAGYFTYSNSATSGFALAGSTYRSIKPPRASNSYVYGVSAAGELAGMSQP